VGPGEGGLAEVVEDRDKVGEVDLVVEVGVAEEGDFEEVVGGGGTVGGWYVLYDYWSRKEYRRRSIYTAPTTVAWCIG